MSFAISLIAISLKKYFKL